MERQFVIETDSESAFVFVYEVTKDYSTSVDYHRAPEVESVVRGRLSPKFYGQLDALLVTNDKIQNAAPIVPQLQEEACTQDS